MLSYLKRNFTSEPMSLKLLLFKTLVRSKLEYAAAIWDPGHTTLVSNIEAIQNGGARFIFCNYHRSASVSAMKSSLSLPLLSLRRKVSRLSLFHKIYYSIPTLKQKLIPPPPHISFWLHHQYKAGIPQCRTSAYLDSFIPRSSLEWNHLPALLVSTSSIDSFRIALSSHFCQQAP
uniref:Putative endonuclease/reverse transcript n=1 Tax=Ixodes ricinus TaxID=34613 RepID=A0A6B0UYG8_IXORI